MVWGLLTLSLRMRCMRTKLHATTIVSMEFEKVCAWYVQVTYDDAIIMIAMRCCRLLDTNSWIAQSSSTKLRKNMRMRSV